jgi:pyridoxamine 5'-phosphate oxidase
MTDDRDAQIASWRMEYEDHGLVEADLGEDPVTAFIGWLSDAQRAGLYEPNAMVVSTVGASGPSARMVLLKQVDRRGFVFYTNYNSRKAEDLDAEPACALLFPWHPLQRQARIEGVAARLSAAESDVYFTTRPRGSQLGAWASPQSDVVPSREFLADRYARESDRFAGIDDIPRPPHWGGYIVRPHRVEFWQGRPGRMHDRISFERTGGNSWVVQRLAP